MKPHRQKTSLVAKVTLGMGSVLVLAVILSTILSFNYSEKLLMTALSEDMVKTRDRRAENLTMILSEVMMDAELISHSSAAQELIKAQKNQDQTSFVVWQKQLERAFSVMVENKDYVQIRFIGLADGGRELVRVDASEEPGDSVLIVRGDSLQQKGHRGYFQVGSKLLHGKSYISPITLNREHGSIQTPWKPTQRFVAPVFLDSQEGKKSHSHTPDDLVGMIVINTNARRLMNQIDDNGLFDITLVNSQGGILHHKDQDLCWGFEFGSHAGLVESDPYAWNLLSTQTDGVDWDAPDGHVHSVVRIPLGDTRDSYLGLIMHAQNDLLLAGITRLKKRVIAIGSLSLLVALLLGSFMVKRLVKPIVLLTEQADQLVGGKRNSIDVSHGSDEVGHLGRTFERLIQQLQGRTREAHEKAAEIKELNDSLEEKVARRTNELVSTQKQLQRDVEIRMAMNKALNLSLYSQTPEQLLNDAVEVLMELEFLTIEDQAAAFLVKDDPEVLVMAANRHLATPLLSLCSEVPFGYCHCGRAARERKILFQSSSDHKHDIQFDGMPPHAHYNVPLMDGPNVVGMLVLYLPHDAQRDEDDVTFLAAYSDILAGAIKRLKAEEELSDSMAELDVARKDAVAANESKSSFLANMSHEIRTPMTAILGYTDLLDEGDLSVEDRQEHLHTIKQNGAHLLTIINDILDISKIESGKMEVENLLLSLWDIVSEVQNLLSIRAGEKDIGLFLDYQYPLPEVINSDPVRLRQVLLNLVGNSIKFTQEGEVRITTSLVDGKIEFAVSDTGIGMSQEQVQRLFKPFSQADVSTTRQFGGTGLGLTISKRLTELMGGGVALESQEGQGSTFTVRIDPGDLTHVAMVDKEPLSIREYDNKSPGNPMAQTTGSILFAEDTLVNQKLAVRILTKAGHQVETANNGQEALDMALDQWKTGQPFEVILMDMQMPVMDGFEATKKLREAGYTGPIIALTANAMASDREKCLQAGCDDFATKPFQKIALLEMISDWMNRTDSLTV